MAVTVTLLALLTDMSVTAGNASQSSQMLMSVPGDGRWRLLKTLMPNADASNRLATLVP